MHEELPVTGTMIYYYQVCHRKLYYFTHELQMEQNNEAVALGRLLDENSYTRDAVRHITIDDTISVDLIRKGKVLHEIKKSRSVEEAVLAAQILSLLSSGTRINQAPWSD